MVKHDVIWRYIAVNKIPRMSFMEDFCYLYDISNRSSLIHSPFLFDDIC